MIMSGGLLRQANPAALADLLRTHAVTRLILVPSLLRVLIAMADEASESTAVSSGSSSAVAPGVEGSDGALAAVGAGSLGALGTLLPKLRYWTTSGEALTFDLMADFFRAYPAAALLNL